MSISAIIQSHGGNFLTTQFAKLHAQLHFSKIDLQNENHQSPFIASVNKTNKIGGIIGVIVSVAGIGAALTAFFLTGSMLSLYAGLPVIPIILAFSMNALLNRLKAPLKEENAPLAAEMKSESSLTNEKQTIPIDNTKILNATSDIKIDPKVEARNRDFAQLIEALSSKQPDQPLVLKAEENYSINFETQDNPKTISLFYNNFTAQEMKALSEALCKDTYYEIIDLSNNYLNNTHIESISYLIKNKKIKSLSLAKNKLTKDDFSKIIFTCQHLNQLVYNNEKINLIDFSNNQIELKKFKKLENIIKSLITIETLDLSNNPINYHIFKLKIINGVDFTYIYNNQVTIKGTKRSFLGKSFVDIKDFLD